MPRDALPPADVGPLVRDLRKRRGVTLQAVADKLGRSVGFVSQIERGLSQPTVDDLVVIAEMLEVPFTYFFPDSATPACAWVTRPHERRTLGFASGVVDQLISPALSSRFFMMETTFAPGAVSGDRNIVDSKEEAGYVLEGQLTVWVGEEESTLHAGDAFQLPSGASSRFANQGDVPTRILWVCS